MTDLKYLGCAIMAGLIVGTQNWLSPPTKFAAGLLIGMLFAEMARREWRRKGKG